MESTHEQQFRTILGRRINALSGLAAYYSEGRNWELPEGPAVKFHLTYTGPLMGRNGGADHVHSIRKAFHPQLRKLWLDHPLLNDWRFPKDPNMVAGSGPIPLMKDNLAEQYTRNGYQFVPLALEQFSALVTLDILFLRAGLPGTILNSADLDARLKTLIDALQMPRHSQDLGSFSMPAEDEKPFFCLMEDDKLVSNINISTDALLQPSATDGRYSKHDARVFIKVHVGTYTPAVWHAPYV